MGSVASGGAGGRGITGVGQGCRQVGGAGRGILIDWVVASSVTEGSSPTSWSGEQAGREGWKDCW